MIREISKIPLCEGGVVQPNSVMIAIDRQRWLPARISVGAPSSLQLANEANELRNRSNADRRMLPKLRRLRCPRLSRRIVPRSVQKAS